MLHGKKVSIDLISSLRESVDYPGRKIMELKRIASQQADKCFDISLKQSADNRARKNMDLLLVALMRVGECFDFLA